jgi:Tat protein secretion system quality control protein TatD with DNase activity
LIDAELVKSALKNIPLSQVFFETDDDDELIVSEVYQLASEVLNIEIEELKDKIYQNYLELYL